jgi:HTH-type transcriptional regulator/antitoxin MqsA
MSQNLTHSCADHFHTVEREREFPIHGTRVSVHEEILRCSVCGEEEYSYEQAIAAERRAGEIYREQNGFLQPDEIVALRRRWGVTQAQLEDALGLGRKTIARWESGRVLQSRALDNLLRAIDQFPGVLVFLAGRQNASIQPNPQWSAEPRTRLSAGLVVPRSVLSQLEREAEEEGTTVDTYVASILSQGIERRATNREVERLHRKFDEAFEHRSTWGQGGMEVTDGEPWLRAHTQIQRERAPKVAY